MKLFTSLINYFLQYRGKCPIGTIKVAHCLKLKCFHSNWIVKEFTGSRRLPSSRHSSGSIKVARLRMQRIEKKPKIQGKEICPRNPEKIASGIRCTCYKVCL